MSWLHSDSGAVPAVIRVCAALAVLGLSFSPTATRANGTHTGHQFAVTEGGAATITIPIQVPRGIGGIEPQLSLNYSSSAGNGLLGVGWTLSGPSAVTRCGKTIEHDGVRGAVTFTKADRFCLDGQRLLSNSATNDDTYGIADTVYWTERESFSRVKAVGGAAGVPAGFEVRTKSGLIMEFGVSADAQAMTNPVDASGPNTINRWMLKRISDRMVAANTVEFFYCAREVVGTACSASGAYTGSNVLHYIRYTNRGGTPGTNAVMFGYESRPDRVLKFQAGVSQVQTQRLTSINTYLGFASVSSLGDGVKRYELTYELLQDGAGQWTRVTNVSRLTRVQELRGGTAPTSPPFASRTAEDALPPLDFAYAPDRVYGKAVSQTAVGGTSAPPLPEYCGGYAGASRIKQLCR